MSLLLPLIIALQTGEEVGHRLVSASSLQLLAVSKLGFALGTHEESLHVVFCCVFLRDLHLVISAVCRQFVSLSVLNLPLLLLGAELLTTHPDQVIRSFGLVHKLIPKDGHCNLKRVKNGLELLRPPDSNLLRNLVGPLMDLVLQYTPHIVCLPEGL